VFSDGAYRGFENAVQSFEFETALEQLQQAAAARGITLKTTPGKEAA
jgi:hypothetical protein